MGLMNRTDTQRTTAVYRPHTTKPLRSVFSTHVQGRSTMKQANVILLELPAAYSSLETLRDELRAMLTDIDGMLEPDVTIYNIQLAVNEIFTNIAEHAYADRSDGQVAVTLLFNDESRQFTIVLHDTGASFDPSTVPAPDLESPQEGGYGLFIVRSLMDDVIYTSGPDGNLWQLVKQL